MSLEAVESEILRFLSSREPEVLCLSGHWGVGKTFAWNRYLRATQTSHKIASSRYSYVSLFGINSLDEFKYSIFENSVNSSDIGVEPSLETLRSNTTAIAKRLGRKSLSFIQQIPFVQHYVGDLGPAWFLSVREATICVDDIERRGEGLSTREVLGLVSTLKEQRKCKVALILNDEALDSDEAEFKKYYEKVVDITLKFAPSPEECVRIALTDNDKAERLLADACVALGISNIRLIKRIERSVKSIENLLAEFDEKVLEQAVKSLALFAWAIFEPNRAPSIEYLETRGNADYLFGDDVEKPVPDKEAAWSALLSAYGFALDEFDLVLLDGVRNGFFDQALLKSRGAKLDGQFRAEKADNSFVVAWSKYHDSFENNQDEVLNSMHEAFFKAAQYVSPINMSSTVGLFKALGKTEQALEMIKHYISVRGSEKEIFSTAYPFASEIKDPDVVQAFKEQYAKVQDERTPDAILTTMAETNGWSPEDIDILSKLPTSEYYALFKRKKGKDLRGMIKVCLQFDAIGNASPEMQEISKRAKEALKQIGRESSINARRVKLYGVEVDSTSLEKTQS